MTVYVSQKLSGNNRFQVNNVWVNILGVWTSETLMAGFLAIINVFFSFSVIHCSRAKPCDKVFDKYWQKESGFWVSTGFQNVMPVFFISKMTASKNGRQDQFPFRGQMSGSILNQLRERLMTDQWTIRNRVGEETESKRKWYQYSMCQKPGVESQ